MLNYVEQQVVESVSESLLISREEQQIQVIIV